MEIHMQNVATNGRVLYFLHERKAILAITGDFELNQNIFTGRMAE
jgi:hypothetical protein